MIEFGQGQSLLVLQSMFIDNRFTMCLCSVKLVHCPISLQVLVLIRNFVTHKNATRVGRPGESHLYKVYVKLILFALLPLYLSNNLTRELDYGNTDKLS